MASTASTNLRLEIQAAGENLNTWGDTRLNETLKRLEDAITDVTALSLSGNHTLTSINFVQDEARAMVIKITDNGLASKPTITAPGVSKIYLIDNTSNTSFDVDIKASGGSSATVGAGVATWVWCDGTDFFAVLNRLNELAAPNASVDINSQKIINVADPVDNQDAATKLYGETNWGGQSAIDAAASAAAALVSENNASASETSAGASASAAAASAATVPTYQTLTGNALKYARLDSGETNMEFRTSSEHFIDIKQAASETATGVVERATDAEVKMGTDTTRVMTPASLKEHSTVSKAWYRLNGTGTISLVGSFNVASVVDNGLGNYTVNYTNTMASSDYSIALARVDGGVVNATITVNNGAANFIQQIARINTAQTDAILVTGTIHGDLA